MIAQDAPTLSQDAPALLVHKGSSVTHILSHIHTLPSNCF